MTSQSRYGLVTGCAVVLLLSPMVAPTASAHPQGPCGSSYTVVAGDTLYSIAQRCRVSIQGILRANPRIDHPGSIEAGWTLDIPGGDRRASDRDQRRDETTRYSVRPGETLFSIAQRFGLKIDELLAANDDLNPLELLVGEVLELPDEAPGAPAEARIGVSPMEGSVGSMVTVRGYGLDPDEAVTLGVGPDQSEWERIREVEVAADGEILERVEVPNWVEPGQELVFVIDRPRGTTLRSGKFQVEPDGNSDRGGRVALEGRVSAGAECPVLTTRDGDLYSLVSDRVEFTPGEYVEISGRRVDVSICMRGTTIEVSEIREVAPPR